MGKRTLFIKWFPYDKRNETISAAIGAGCHFIHCFRSRRPWNAPLRYLGQFAKTLLLLSREKPRVVFVTNPPIFAAATVALYCAFSGSRFVIDAHSGVFAPKWRLFEPLHRYLARRALRVIVTNQAMEGIFREWGASTAIVSDLVMDIPRTTELALDGFSLMVICSYDPDEPIAEILAAAADIPEATFHFTGNNRRLDPALREGQPANVRFTGYLPDPDFFDLLHACDGVMVLVDADNTMQQGAYEAVSVKKPMVLSDWPLLRRVYDRGAVFVRNDRQSIAAGVRELMANHDRLRREMEELYAERLRVWNRTCRELRALADAGDDGRDRAESDTICQRRCP